MDARAKTGVSIRSAVKRYGPVVALDDVSLDIAPGEFVSLLGPSGSGKTTLLGILGGFVQPSSGTVWVGERDITFAPPHKRNIGIVFQNYALFPHMTVGENVAFALRARREPKAGWAKKVADALAMVELSGYEGRGISQLSGGQRQRVALARAMVFEPQLILMDEPLSALDKQLRETMQIELRRLHRKLGATIVYVTHDQREALTMSDRVAVLKNGKLVQIDTPERLYDRPCDAFVASFIGEATLLGVSRAGDDAVRLGETVLRTAHPLPRGDRLLLAVQTEKLVIDGNDAHANANRLSCRVTEVLYQGESLRVFATLADGTAISLRQPGNYEARKRIPEPGAQMTVALDPLDTIVVPA
ncbi:ABC transporter ATP-binding protein [Paraburkholderia sp. GAS334]|uniref:ABC transporter ATP-binding protein n=1 Tax=Paraburkholderia sp. GAS334 TaxID=3035131 RepID=UPI003D1C6BC9